MPLIRFRRQFVYAANFPAGAAVAFLLGWRDVATLHARYFHPSKRHADACVAKVNRK
jgi:hypothetical protein